MNLKNVSRDWGINKWRCCVEGWLDCICERRARSADIEVVKKEKRSDNDGARCLKKEGCELKQKGGLLPWQVDTSPQEGREDGFKGRGRI